MSLHLVLRGWQGADPAEAAGQLARLFRMNPEDALRVVERVRSGEKWKFEQPIGEAQARVALPFLSDLGFQVQRESLNSFVHLEDQATAPDPEGAVISEEVVEAEEAEYLRSEASLVLLFQGDVWDLMALYIKNWLLMMVTFGGWFFKGRTDVRRYLCRQIWLGGDPFQYHGRAWDLVTSWFTAAAVLLLGLIGLVWVHRVDPQLAPAAQYGLLAAGLAVLPALWVNSQRYRLSRTTWLDIRFGFQGTALQAVLLYLKGVLFLVATFGLYLPVFVMDNAAFWRSQTTLGNRPFRFSGKWQDVFREYAVAWAATVLTLGAALPCWLWVAGRTRRYLWKHTHFDRGTFEYSASPMGYALHWSLNALLLLVTLGLGYPWVLERNLRFLTRHLSLEGLPQWNQLVRQLQPASKRRVHRPSPPARLQRV